MDDIFKKLETYINLRNYFWGYVIKYAENNNISKSDIDNWNLSENWLVIDYYDDEGNLEILDIPTEIFLDFIKNYKQ
jgi:hypothetical protein